MKYILILAVVIILIIVFKKWWESNWRSFYGEGIKRFRAKDYHGASEQFFKAKLKKPDNWEVSYYCGLADKHISDRMNSREAIETKKFAITCFIDTLELNPSHMRSNNMIEMILSDEKDTYVLKELIKDTRHKLGMTPNEVKKQFNYIDKIEENIKEEQKPVKKTAIKYYGSLEKENNLQIKKKFSDLIKELESLSSTEGFYTRDKVAWWLIKYEGMYEELSKTKDTLEAEFPSRNLRVHKEFIKELLFIELYEGLELSFAKTDSDSKKQIDLNEIINKIKTSTNGLSRKDKNFKWDSSPR